MDILDTIRRKRNQINYEHAGTTSEAEAAEFYRTITTLRADVVRWIIKEHPALVPAGLNA